MQELWVQALLLASLSHRGSRTLKVLSFVPIVVLVRYASTFLITVYCIYNVYFTVFELAIFCF